MHEYAGFKSKDEDVVTCKEKRKQKAQRRKKAYTCLKNAFFLL
jgi:hypothetical protein